MFLMFPLFLMFPMFSYIPYVFLYFYNFHILIGGEYFRVGIFVIYSAHILVVFLAVIF